MNRYEIILASALEIIAFGWRSHIAVGTVLALLGTVLCHSRVRICRCEGQQHLKRLECIKRFGVGSGYHLLWGFGSARAQVYKSKLVTVQLAQNSLSQSACSSGYVCAGSQMQLASVNVWDADCMFRRLHS